jgi:hypothetical protein
MKRWRLSSLALLAVVVIVALAFVWRTFPIVPVSFEGVRRDFRDLLASRLFPEYQVAIVPR